MKGNTYILDVSVPTDTKVCQFRWLKEAPPLSTVYNPVRCDFCFNFLTECNCVVGKDY